MFTALTLLPACTSDAPLPLEGTGPDFARAGYDVPGAHRQYGAPVTLGEGKVRSYVVLDAKAGQAPLEFGVAIDARALEGELPADASMHILPLPQKAPAPYEFVMFDWNPAGHEPPGIYDLPHFDMHFYLVPQEEVAAISPADPDFRAKANNLPTGPYVPANYFVLAPPGWEPFRVAVPGMGVHWSDFASPEFNGQPFSRTFIYGSWDGRFTFIEPMVTRAYLLGRPEERLAIPQPAAYPEPGWYPTHYRTTYDPQAREYRVGLTGFVWRS